jgi:superfamily II DNA or RNA helicase
LVIRLVTGAVDAQVFYHNEDMDAIAAVSDILAWPMPNAHFAQRNLPYHWDGKIRLYDKRSATYPAGLTDTLARGLEARGYAVECYTELPDIPVVDDLPEIRNLTWTPEQTEALTIAQQATQGVFQMTVGTGKGELIPGVCRLRKGRVLVTVHSQDLWKQTMARLRARLDEPIGEIAGPRWQIERVTVAMYQTLYERLISEHARDIVAYLGSVETLIIDEVHHATAETYTEILRLCAAPVRYGFSATAFEKDPTGRPRTLKDAKLVGLVGEMLYQLRQYQVEVSIQIAEFYATVHQQAPYEVAYERDILGNDLALHFQAKWARGHVAKGRHGLILVSRRVHGDRVAATLGVTFRSGRDPLAARTRLLRDFNARQVPCAVIGKIWDEGIDLPALDWMILADPGVKSGKVIQRIGRAARARPDKATAYLLDTQIVGHAGLEEQAKARNRTYKLEGFTRNVLGRWGRPFVGFGRKVHP